MEVINDSNCSWINDLSPRTNFKSIDKTNPCNLIKFNVGNEYAVDLFKQKKINYPEIMQIIKEITSLNFNSDVNTIDKIIQYHENIKVYIQDNY